MIRNRKVLLLCQRSPIVNSKTVSSSCSNSQFASSNYNEVQRKQMLLQSVISANLIATPKYSSTSVQAVPSSTSNEMLFRTIQRTSSNSHSSFWNSILASQSDPRKLAFQLAPSSNCCTGAETKLKKLLKDWDEQRAFQFAIEEKKRRVRNLQAEYKRHILILGTITEKNWEQKGPAGSFFPYFSWKGYNGPKIWKS